MDCPKKKLLNNKRSQQVQPAEDFPLRGVLKCWCGKSMTTGWSKGKKKYYLYYQCLKHTNVNIPGQILHELFDKVLMELSFQLYQIKALLNKTKAMLTEPIKQKQDRTKENMKLLDAVNEKIYTLERRFMDSEIESPTYNRWFQQYKEEKAQLEHALSGKARSKDSSYEIIERILHWMAKLFFIYQKCNIFQTHIIVRAVFKDNLAFAGGAFRTSFIDRKSDHNLLIIKEKGLIFREQSFQYSDINPISTPNRSRTY